MKAKYSFIKTIVSAIKDFDKYVDFAASKTSDTIIYILKIVAIFSVFLAQISIYNVSKDVNNAHIFIEENISKISYNNGNLEVKTEDDNPIIVENRIFNKIIIDTTDNKEEQDKYISEIQKSGTGLVLLKDKLVIKSEMSNSMSITYSYNELLDNYNINTFDKDFVLNLISGTNILKFYALIFVILYIYMFVIYFINILLDIILIAFLGYFTSILLRLRIKYIAMCRMVAYSLTLPIILNIIYIVVNAFTGYTIQYFDIVYIAISYIYIVAAILLLKSDMIKRGKELQEIIKEQERIREELERKRLEEERQKEEERKKKEKEEEEKRKKEKEEKDGNIGSEPQGDNA